MEHNKMKGFLPASLLVIIFLCVNIHVFPQVHDPSWKNLVHEKNNIWFASDSAIIIAENVLLYQRDIGGWPKNIQMHQILTDDEKKILLAKKSSSKECTTDNGATITEMNFLSKVYRQIPNAQYKEAFLLGLDYLIRAQYENGGWPQFYPLEKGYSRYITYNDNSMANIMNLLHEVANNTGYYSILPDSEMMIRTQTAFNKGIECILNTQYIQNNVPTAWCAQYDEITLLPAKARSYELPSLSGKESAGLVLLLMNIEKPSDQIIAAVKNAVNWFEKTKISGLKIEKYKTENGLREKRVVADTAAPAIWPRFMELEDNTPFFCDRDGIKKSSMDQISQERRVGYGWYSDDPQEVLNNYPAWKAKWLGEEK